MVCSPCNLMELTIRSFEKDAPRALTRKGNGLTLGFQATACGVAVLSPSFSNGIKMCTPLLQIRNKRHAEIRFHLQL